LTCSGEVQNIHYGDILTKFGDVVDCSKEEIPFVADKSKLGKKISYLQNGDIIIADTAEDDAVGKATEILNIQTPVVSGLHTMACRPQFEFEPRFLGYYINSACYHNQLYPFMQGVKVTSVSKGNIALTEIHYPANDEQHKIASMLALIDARIEKQRTLIESLKLYKRGVLQRLFKANITEHKENNIGSLFTVTRGYVLPLSEIRVEPDNEYCYPVYSSQTKNEGLMGYYNQYLYEDAITWTTDGANAGFVRFRKGKFYCTNVCGVLLNDDGFANEYIAERLNSVTKRHVSYVGNPKLMNNVMAEITIEYPSLEEQRKNSLLISQMDKKIQYETSVSDSLAKLKTALLQQMFI